MAQVIGKKLNKTIGLINWSGHNNIGDDVMASCIQKALEDRGYKVINQGEKPDAEGIDAFFWGGGTLVSQCGLFPPPPAGVPIIGFGIGVCEAPPSKFEEFQFRDIQHVFARDIYSYIWMCQHKVPCTLSFDPVFLLDLPELNLPREYTAVNVIASYKTNYSEIKDRLKDHFGDDFLGFSVGLPEDPIGASDFKLEYKHYTDPFELHEFLSKAKVAITTRLHAAVFAYLAKVPEIDLIVYDPKVIRFKEYVMDNKLDPKFMNERLNRHIELALTMI
jgi:polysaccharide pyruvyl transferase WcaK-like protein